MRATKDRLAENFIVIVARELAKALRGLHDAGIIHRDIKAANVLIHEDGNLQLCDFGVANVLDTRTDKRRTFIGTLHWMPPELWTEKPEYSDEVDVWEYGCTLYECALGRPPNSDLRERQQLKMRMRRLKQAIALPENESFSDGLRELIKFTLSPEVASRPSMKGVLEHEFLKDTEETHPTKELSKLVQNYYAWLFSGGQRVSLFMPGGAPAAATEDPDAKIEDSDEWNFSTTQDFERRVSTILEIPDLSDLAAEFESEDTPRGPKVTELSPPRHMTAAQKANFEARVNRGAADLSNLFDQSAPAYEYKTKTDFIPVPEHTTPEKRRTSDLPFRAMAEDRPSSIASVAIDLGDFDESDYAAAAPRTGDNIQTTYADTPMKGQTIRLADAATLRQKRADSKGPRDPSLTARRDSSTEDLNREALGIAAQDFAAAQEEWTSNKGKGKQPELQEAAEITSSNPARATMDWSFADAMAGMGGTITSGHQATVSEPLPASETTSTNIPVPQSAGMADEPGPEEDSSAPSAPASRSQSQARARATLDWSFSDAMSELNTSANDSPVVTINQPAALPTPQRSTPSRPTALTRQMTMPVTNSDFITLAEDDTPPSYHRPATAMSDAHSTTYSDADETTSLSSVDIDPFALEHSSDEMPGPATLDADTTANGGRGMGGFYASRGRTLLPDHPFPTDFLPASAGARPPRAPRPQIGDDAYPGPAPATLPAGARLAQYPQFGGSGSGNGGSSSHSHSHSRGSGSGSQVGSGGSGGRVLTMPDVAPPSLAALSGNVSNEELAAELERLLEGFAGTLEAAAGVFGAPGGGSGGVLGGGVLGGGGGVGGGRRGRGRARRGAPGGGMGNGEAGSGGSGSEGA